MNSVQVILLGKSEGLSALRGFAQHQLGKTQNGVERRAQFVAHIRKENAFGPICRFGLLLGRAQFMDELAQIHDHLREGHAQRILGRMRMNGDFARKIARRQLIGDIRHVAQVGDHFPERIGQNAHFILCGDGDLLIHFAFGDSRGHPAQLRHRLGHAARRLESDQCRYGDNRQNDDRKSVAESSCALQRLGFGDFGNQNPVYPQNAQGLIGAEDIMSPVSLDALHSGLPSQCQIDRRRIHGFQQHGGFGAEQRIGPHPFIRSD